MSTSNVNSWAVFLIGITILGSAIESGLTATGPTGINKLGREKAELYNVALQHLNKVSLQNLNKDLNYLKISESKINQIDKFAFDHFKHLNLLDLSDNNITHEIHPDTFSRLTGLEILVLKNLGLRQISLNLTNVQELILSHNEIENFDGRKIIARNVNYLDVSSNQIQQLVDSFEFFNKLSMIDISRNRLNFIKDGVFENNTNLLRILASENNLNSTNGLKLPWLRTLNLFANKLSVVNSDAFSQMNNLEELVLAFNEITKLDDPFVDLKELKFLNLAWNYLDYLSPELFRNNPYLTNLSLQGNKLKALKQFVGDHHHLERLDLSHNDLALIDDEFFENMPNLNFLDLSFNKLKTLTDSLAPLSHLKVLNLAFNRISLNGWELSMNYQLTKINATSNEIDVGLSLFKNNSLLTSLDLGDNLISNFCDSEVSLNGLSKLNLKGNHIKSLHCLKAKNFSSLCEVVLTNNPLTCGTELDEVMLHLATLKSSPYKFMSKFGSDVAHTQCATISLNQSLALWNSMKRNLCSEGEDLQLKDDPKTKEWENNEEEEEDDVSDASAESSESAEEISSDGNRTPSPKIHSVKDYFIFVPIGRIDKKNLLKDNVKNPQSERLSWEKIDQNPEIDDGFEEEEHPVRETRFSWYTIALILIGISLFLALFNLLAFMYIRLKVWKKSDTNSTQKYKVLRNEVYKKTTEPTYVHNASSGEWPTGKLAKNKLLYINKINDYLINFAANKKDRDNESAKNVLIGPSNC